MMDESKTPPTHLGSCRYLDLYRERFGFVHHSIAIFYHEVPNPNITIRNIFIAVRYGWESSARGRHARLHLAAHHQQRHLAHSYSVNA